MAGMPLHRFDARTFAHQLPALPLSLIDPFWALAAYNIAARHELAMANAAMYSTALEFGATFWTQGVDYQGLPGVRYQAKTAA